MAEKVQLQSLKCSICHETFKTPTLLTCGHTFCKVCLDEYDQQYRVQDFIQCPFCRKRTKLVGNRVAGLSPNFSLKGLQEELHARAHLKVNGKSPKYCSLHNQVYKDILCKDCNEFICLTCLFNKHQGHMFQKKEELEAELKNKKKSLIVESEMKKAQIKNCITQAEKQMRYIKSHIEKLYGEIEKSFEKKSEILKNNRYKLLEDLDKIRTNLGKGVKEFAACQRQSLQKIDAKSTPMGRESIDFDALETLYIEFLDLENELERVDLNETSVAQAKQEVENTKFYPSNENDIDLGTLDQETSESESG